MNAERDRFGGILGVLLDESALTVAASRELTSPLVLLRQLGLAISADDISDDERKQLSRQMTLTSERALRMAANLGMTSAKQSSLSLEPINPVSICQDVIHELSPLFLAHGQSIKLTQRTRIPLLVGNRQLLTRILLGFGDNALHYGSPDHPVQMTIQSLKGRVRIGVRDWGPAVPVDVWDRLESKIARHAVAPLPARPYTSGVSLVAARKLAELMECSVGLTRHRDGATFYVDLLVSKQMSLI